MMSSLHRRMGKLNNNAAEYSLLIEVLLRMETSADSGSTSRRLALERRVKPGATRSGRPLTPSGLESCGRHEAYPTLLAMLGFQLKQGRAQAQGVGDQ